MNTMLLDRTAWDICLDASGSIAMASNPYAVAQDASSAIRTFAGECWYDTTQGIPYQTRILGKRPSAQFLKAQFAAAALTVPETASAKCFITQISGRTVTGQVQITDVVGQTSVAAINSAPPLLRTETGQVLLTEAKTPIAA